MVRTPCKNNRCSNYWTAVILIICVLAAPALEAEPRTVNWRDLVPEPEQYDNPFSALSPEQSRSLRTLLRFQQADGSADSVITHEEASELRAALESDGLDVDGLFEQRLIIMEARQRLGTATQAGLLGQSVRIRGYLLPLEIKDHMAIEFLLVPTAGACVHTPPPPANQTIRVHYPGGFLIKKRFTPVWVSGALLAESTVETVRYEDGESRVETSYAMSADTVEPY